MFLYQLSLMEKMAFVQLAKEMVTVDDDKIDSHEFGLVSVMANEMQVSVDSVLSIEFDLKQLSRAFESSQAKRICIAELLSLALVNKKFHERQKMLLDSLVDFFEMNVDELAEIEAWVNESMACSVRGTKLILGEGK